MDYTERLNDKQKEAVLTTEGPVLIVAGAGAGKTKTITHRILHLIKKGVHPHNILAITFTNKAGKEMRERVEDLLFQDPLLRAQYHNAAPFISTFHSLGVFIIKQWSDRLNLPRHFAIFDKTDSKKVLKKALESLNVEPKEHLDKVASIISREKGLGVSYDDFASRQSYDFSSDITARVWNIYESTLKKEKALDFDDLLLKSLELLEKHTDIRAYYQNLWHYVHIDEYQDTNKVQNKIAELISEHHRNICVVGDVDQCLVAGTKIQMGDQTTKNIENVRTGDLVLSNYGGGDFREAKVISHKTRSFSGNLIRIETSQGSFIESTEDHIHFAGYLLGITPQIYINYLMYKKEVGWRIGSTSVHTKGQKKSVIGFVQRSNQEHADAVWVIATHKTPQEARIQEYIFSLTYQIPTIPFIARKGLSTNGYVHDATSLKQIFSSFDTDKSAEKLLADLNLSADHPHHRPQTRGSRKNINITLCADKRGTNPMHLISIHGNNILEKEKLESLGFSVRKTKKDTKSWRFETVRADYGEACLLATNIATIFPESTLMFRARLGGKKINTKDSNSLQCLPAHSLMPGMAMFTKNGYDTIKNISRIPTKKTTVYDIDIERTHNFIANNIVTHNCIYSWRGAEIKSILQFEKKYPETKTILLEQNYRSTKMILAVADDIISKNKWRIPKKLFTENTAGGKVRIYEAFNEVDEAHFIAQRSKEMIESGIQADEIAVLFRANFQSRILEEAFLAYGVPYQMLGTKFFERKEIKDMLSYIKSALNPESSIDLARIINVPPRGIGKVTLEKIEAGETESLPIKTQEKIRLFRDMLARIKTFILSNKTSDSIRFIVDISGMAEAYSQGNDEDQERLENIMELVTLATGYDELLPEEGIEQLLTDAALVSDQDSLKKETSGVKLMTVHSSKGLEFDSVFISGMEEDLFPHRRFGEKKKEGEDSEEERRLFYVAITRARKTLYLTLAQMRTIFGNKQINTPSHFIADINEDFIEREKKSMMGPAGGSSSSYFSIDF